MSKDLRKRGFNFVGPTICYAFMQAVGMVNDHLVDCFRYRKWDRIIGVAKHIGIVAISAEGAALCYRTICVEGARTFGSHNHPEVTMHTHAARAVHVANLCE